ncbi:MAG: hypothetical protein AAFX86_07830 [Pseudomonadota bacterium]
MEPAKRGFLWTSIAIGAVFVATILALVLWPGAHDAFDGRFLDLQVMIFLVLGLMSGANGIWSSQNPDGILNELPKDSNGLWNLVGFVAVVGALVYGQIWLHILDVSFRDFSQTGWLGKSLILVNAILLTAVLSISLKGLWQLRPLGISRAK